MFIGKQDNCIDSKSRMIVPAKFRDELGEVCVITIGIDKCLCVYPMDAFLNFGKKLETLPQSDEDVREFTRTFLSNAETVSIDKQGRINIKPELKEYAMIEKDLVTIGNLNKVEIWSREVWEERNRETLSPAQRAQKMVEYGI